MRSVTSSAAALAADRAAETEFGYPSWLLMEEAGIRLQDRVETRTSGPAVYLAGSGNNGGDALVMARHAVLRGLRDAAVVQVFPPSSPSCRLQDERARRVGVPVLPWPSEEARAALSRAELWVDGIWGTGLSSAPRLEAAETLRALEALRARLGKPSFAIDVPSGLWDGWSAGDPALAAERTLAPGWIKEVCLFPAAREFCGTLEAVVMAFPRPAEAMAQLIEPEDLAALLPKVAADDHKGRRGHVGVVGGSEGMTGAAVLAARSAAAAGAGLVSVGCDETLVPLIAGQVPAFQVRSAAGLMERAARLDAFVVGPGWGLSEDRPALLGTVWATGLPLVVDADGLRAFQTLAPAPRAVPVVLTPHPGEFSRLTSQKPTARGPIDAAAALAAQRGVAVVLKGAVTWTFAPDGRRAVWDGANPTLATGGSGDCLAGVTGALLAKGLGAFEAAAAAVALHGAAGRALADEAGWYTADRLPEALAKTAAACMAVPAGI